MEIAISFIGGLALFIYGMNIMASGLQKYAGSRMKELLAVLTKNRLMSVLVGAAVTAIIQSSSATTVMVVGFVNAGVMNLMQACGVIMGANIGTTATAWIVASSEWATYLNPVKLAPLILGIGVALYLFASKNKVKKIGEIIIGFALLFIGINTMSSSTSTLKDLPMFRDLFISFSTNPILGVFVGAAFTAIVQSSSASIGILQILAIEGLIPLNAAVFIITGQNIGTCITALLSSIGASKSAKCAAYIHLLFNVIGTIIFVIIAVVYFKIINPIAGTRLINGTDISIIHSIFNVGCTVILFNFPNMLINLAKKIAKVTDEDLIQKDTVHLDDRILSTPSFALENAKLEVIRMGYIVLNNLKLSIDAAINKDEIKCAEVLKIEDKIDNLDTQITEYLVKVCQNEISSTENSEITSLIQIIGNMERVGDHSENIADIGNYIISENCKFSALATEEITSLGENVVNCFEKALKSLENEDISLSEAVLVDEENIDEIEENLRYSHIKRLTLNQCEPKVGVAFLDMLTNFERISDHAKNIAEAIMSEKNFVKQSKV